MGRQGKSRLQRLREKGKLLDEILTWKREEVARKRRERPVAILRALAATVPPPTDILAVLQSPGVHIIGEIVRATPAHGLLSHHFNVDALVDVYVEGGVDALSVMTDARFFQGKLEYLTAVKENLRRRGVHMPVVQRDFFLDVYQVWEARVAGADAVSLPVVAVGDKTLRELLVTVRSLGMEAIVEVHTEQELARALAAGARIVGVNNRDVRTFTVDVSVTERLRPLIPPDVWVVSEEGGSTREDIQRLTAAGVHAILVGDAIVRARPDARLHKIKAWVQAAR